METQKNLVVLGSTGSIGLNVIKVVEHHSQRLNVVGLAANRNWQALAKQIKVLKPKVAVIFERDFCQPLREEVKNCDVTILSGMEGLLELVSLETADVVVSSMVGAIGLRPVLAAIEAGKTICLANKETLVVGGAIVTAAAKSRGVQILPIDSEHSAIFQCLQDGKTEYISRLILTASGGPFREFSPAQLEMATPDQALKHPNWDMGGKITIDSATLMNKGLEVIEAHWLFGMDFDRFDVVIHTQSIVHSMIEFIDGSIISQLGATDMKGPIQYSLSYPQRWTAAGKRVDLTQIGQLDFSSPRWDDFPCLKLGFEAGRKGGNQPCILNGANEVAVDAFLRRSIGFLDIPKVIKFCMREVPFIPAPGLDELLAADLQTRVAAQNLIDKMVTSQ